jgi:hypothetical protein
MPRIEITHERAAQFPSVYEAVVGQLRKWRGVWAVHSHPEDYRWWFIWGVRIDEAESCLAGLRIGAGRTTAAVSSSLVVYPQEMGELPIEVAAAWTDYKTAYLGARSPRTYRP